GQRDPDAPADVRVLRVARPEGDEERCEVLDEQRDADRQAVDREEVEELHERESADAEGDYVRKLAARESQPAGVRDDEHRDEPERRAERTHLREPLRREAGGEDRLRHRAVHAPEHGRDRGHQVPEPRMPHTRRLDGKGRFAQSSAPASRRMSRTYLSGVSEKRDVGVVLSGGGVNGVMMELGFLQRLRESVLWPRIAAIFGTSSGALSGVLAALDRLDDLEAFLLQLQPEQAFRPNRLWRLPFLGLHDYALPGTVDAWFGNALQLARDLVDAPVELVVIATDLSDDHERERDEYELHYSSRTTPPEEFAQAVLASAAVSALVLPMRVGDRIATDGAWVRNFPLGVAYDHPDVELIAAFRYLPQYPKLGIGALEPLRRRLRRIGRVAPVRALLAEIDEAEARAERGEPAH